MREFIRTGKVMIATKDGEWRELGHMDALGTRYLDAGIEDDIVETLRDTHRATFTVDWDYTSPEFKAVLYGGWVTGSAKDELRWRLNERLQGRDPGQPKNWTGLTDETRGRFVPRQAILRASTDKRRTNA